MVATNILSSCKAKLAINSKFYSSSLLEQRRKQGLYLYKPLWRNKLNLKFQLNPSFNLCIDVMEHKYNVSFQIQNMGKEYLQNKAIVNWNHTVKWYVKLIIN